MHALFKTHNTSTFLQAIILKQRRATEDQLPKILEIYLTLPKIKRMHWELLLTAVHATVYYCMSELTKIFQLRFEPRNENIISHLIKHPNVNFRFKWRSVLQFKINFNIAQ